jgi:GntR family transcriptional repressor for pyruvate dehydrogenase complex
VAQVAPRDFARLQPLDAAFHMRLVEAAGNRFLRQTLGVLQEMLAAGMETTLVVPGRLEKSRGEHDRILAAVRAGDAAGARAAARKHIRGAYKVALRRLEAERLMAEAPTGRARRAPAERSPRNLAAANAGERAGSR